MKIKKEYIEKYELLCYCIWFLSCSIVRNNIWRKNKEDKSKKNNIYYQKIVIFSIIDILNSILENKKNIYIYKNVSSLFFYKLNLVFTDSNILKKIKNKSSHKVIEVDGKKIWIKLHIFYKFR